MTTGEDPPAGRRTQCLVCQGDGVVVVARMAVIDGRYGSAPEVKRCAPCDGEGWLDGLQPPL